MRGHKAKIPRAINTGAYLDCVDNTGARTLFVMAVTSTGASRTDSPVRESAIW